MAEEKTKKKKFNLYDFLNGNNSKKDISDEEANKPRNLAYFFTLFGRNFSRIFELNIIFVIGNLPVLFLILAISGLVSAKGSAAQSALFAQLFASSEVSEASPAFAALFGIYGLSQTVNVMTWKTYLCYGLGALTLITFGPVSCACFYNLRNIINGKPVFLLSDSLQTIKKNLKNGIFFGIFDLLCGAIIAYDIITFYYNLDSGSFFMGVCFWLSIAVAVIYLFMRMYIYLMTVTFDLKFFKIIKNAFIFAFIGLKRNLLALIGIAAVVFVNYLLLMLTQTFGLGIILPLVLTCGVIMFIMAYAAWPKIKEIMIDPYYNPDGTPIETEAEGK